MTAGTGYQMQDGRFANTEQVIMLPSQAFPAGNTIGAAIEAGGKTLVRLTLAATAKSGTNPTLDVTVQTARSPAGPWRSVGTFAQQSDVLLAMTAVTAAGTTPPTITLTGTPTAYVNLRVECTTLGARGTAVIRYSLDGGTTWTEGVTTAATISIGAGLTLNYANATAAVDNVWTARSAGYEEKAFHCDRFIRGVCYVGGSSNPTVTASLVGELAGG